MAGSKLKPQNANIPWVVAFEFPSHADAKAFAEMVEEQFGDQAVVRKKNAVFNQGAFTNWRSTRAIRTALSGRSFTYEMIGEILANHGFAGTRAAATTWIFHAHAEGVVKRLERGVYEFVPLPAAATSTPAYHDPLCTACQPEPLQCAAP